MKLIVGLGNPGEKYARTRHNVGFAVAEALAAKMGGTEWQTNRKFNAEISQVGNVILAKPQTFMNASGQAVSAILNFYKIGFEDLYVIHDDLDIALGQYKLQLGKGPQLHYGIASVDEQLGTEKYWRVRVGVENRQVRGNKGIPGIEYSLQNFFEEERKILEALLPQIVIDLEKRVVS